MKLCLGLLDRLNAVTNLSQNWGLIVFQNSVGKSCFYKFWEKLLTFQVGRHVTLLFTVFIIRSTLLFRGVTFVVDPAQTNFIMLFPERYFVLLLDPIRFFFLKKCLKVIQVLLYYFSRTFFQIPTINSSSNGIYLILSLHIQYCLVKETEIGNISIVCFWLEDYRFSFKDTLRTQ